MSGDTVKLKVGARTDGTSTSSKPATDKVSGRVKHDDRGNAIWEWAVSTGAIAVDSVTQRLKRLDNPTLSLADEASNPVTKGKPNARNAAQGYSPYDSGLPVKKDTAPRKKDLRRLSEWLKLKKQADGNKSD
jgi:hypothetical protein